MRKLLSIFQACLLLTGFLLAMAFFAMPVTARAAGFSGDDGLAGNPYIITTPGQLNEVRDNLPAHYRAVTLTSDGISRRADWLQRRHRQRLLLRQFLQTAGPYGRHWDFGR